MAGLAKRLGNPTVQVLLLPGDPETDVVNIGDEVWEWLSTAAAVTLDGSYVHFGDQKCPSAHAAVVVGTYSRENWNHYLALHRSGAIEVGLGDMGGRRARTRAGDEFRVFNLRSTVGWTWATLAFAEAARTRFEVDGPWQLTVALIGTEDALLGNLGEGWAEPDSFENEVGGCRDHHLMWHFELDELPVGDGQRDLALRVGARIEDAWGVTHRRYFARRGEKAGELDLRGVAR